MNFDRVDQLMRAGVDATVFPGAVLLVFKEDRIEFFESYGMSDLFSQTLMRRETVFDLASLTKPLATTLAVMELVRRSDFCIDRPIGDIIPEFGGTAWNHVTTRQLLCHSAGFRAYHPYYLQLKDIRDSDRKRYLRQCLLKESLVYPPGQGRIYSDIGFMILEWMIEQVSGDRMDRFLDRNVYVPIGLNGLYFNDLTQAVKKASYAATEWCSWRHVLLIGQVHDDNAWIAGGICGHAGLFGSAMEIYRLLVRLLMDYRFESEDCFFDRSILSAWFSFQTGAEIAPGFDMPGKSNSSCGQYFSPHSIGHLGFTGTSFWMDMEKGIGVILLTNRVHPSRYSRCNPPLIRTFRPALHDGIMRTMGNISPCRPEFSL
ncbi:MAG: serine hydrolase domain-containing protein [Desulfatirhabdiaceae bacterium]